MPCVANASRTDSQGHKNPRAMRSITSSGAPSSMLAPLGTGIIAKPAVSYSRGFGMGSSSSRARPALVGATGAHATPTSRIGLASRGKSTSIIVETCTSSEIGTHMRNLCRIPQPSICSRCRRLSANRVTLSPRS